jgi:hypothetical protein
MSVRRGYFHRLGGPLFSAGKLTVGKTPVKKEQLSRIHRQKNEEKKISAIQPDKVPDFVGFILR